MEYFLKVARHARKAGASDLHIIRGLAPAIRLNGEIDMLKGEPLTADNLRLIIRDMLNDVQKEHLEKEKELCFSVQDDEAGRMRVSIYFHAGVPEIAVRFCAYEIPDAATLGLPTLIPEMARRPNGLVLITGATGAGKTTTLNFMIDQINRERRCKIITIEDPVEFLHRPIRSIVVQQEVYTDVLSFPKALIHVLRQNPDVIVIGEMRELETISTALTAAETGHLVLATLHTPNVAQTMERITSVFTSEQQKQITLQLSNSLQCVIAQDLVPRADGKGRVLAYEIMVANLAVRNMIRENTTHLIDHVIITGRKEGMLSMDMCLTDLYQKAIISYDAAISRARDPKAISRSVEERYPFKK